MQQGSRVRLKRSVQVHGWGTVPAGTEGTILSIKPSGEFGVHVTVTGPEEISQALEVQARSDDLELA